MAKKNLVDINKLVKVSTYARTRKPPCSHPWVDRLAEQGEIEIIRIDGVKFVKIT